MVIGIDVSQIVYSGTGVANYTRKLVGHLLKIDRKNQYVLFGSSLRKKGVLSRYLDGWSKKHPNVKGKIYSLPPAFWNLVWNWLHVFPVEWFMGKVDVFLSSDWTQPPTLRAKKVTTVHDLTPWRFPRETHPRIVKTHRRRMAWVKKEIDLVLADSKATKADLKEILGFPEGKVRVVYLGK